METQTKETYQQPKFSYSRTEVYENCPYRYYLQYVKGHYISATSLALSYGTLVHKINQIQTEMLLAGKPIDYPMLKDYFQNVNIPKKSSKDKDGDIFGVNILRRMFHDDWETLDKTGRTFEEKAQAFLERGIYRQEEYLAEHPELKLFAAEMPFEYYFNKVLFTGSIDRVLQYRDNPKHFVIHDLKTSAEAYDDKKLTSPRQMWVYVGALKERFGDDIQVDCEYEFPVAEEMRKAGTKGWEKRCETKMRKILDDIFNENWTAHPSPLCFYCAFCNNNPNQPTEAKNLCPYYSLWTPQDRSFAVRLPWHGIEMDEIQHKKLEQLEALDDEFADEIEKEAAELDDDWDL